MHKTDQAAYSAMLTAELARRFAGQKKMNNAALQKFFMRALSRQLKSGTLEKHVYRYLVRILMPKSSGFTVRWSSYFNRFQQISYVNKAFKDKSDLERLEAALRHLAESAGVVTAFDIEDTHTFEGKEKEQVAQRGFVGMAISQRKVIDENGCFDDLLVLSVFAPCEASRLKILSTFQLFGFDLFGPETEVQPRKVGFISIIGTMLQQKKAA